MFGSKINPSGAAADTGDAIANSIRLDRASSTHMDLTSATARTSSTTGTISFWYKPSKLGQTQEIFTTSNAGQTERFRFYHDNDDRLYLYIDTAASNFGLKPTRVLRDTNSFYHVCAVLDTSNGTSDDTLQIWINGVRETVFTIDNRGTLPASQDHFIGTGELHTVGGLAIGNTNYVDGRIADFIYVDGQALDPTSFGRFSTTHTTDFVPITYAGTYGNRGFHLDFAVAPGTGNGAGTDVSGNGLHFTDANLGPEDQSSDTPTNVYPALDPLNPLGGVAISNGNQQAGTTTNNGIYANWVIPDGKWYWEVNTTTLNAHTMWGIAKAGTNLVSGTDSLSGQYTHANSGLLSDDGTGTASWSSAVAAGSVVGIAVYKSGSAIRMWFADDNSWLNSGDPANDTSPAITDTITEDILPILRKTNASAWDVTINFGQLGLTHTPPTGFSELSQANLPNVVTDLGGVDKPYEHYQNVLWTGNATTRSITGVGFQPDLLWIKDRDNTANFSNSITDAVRGVTKHVYTDSARAELTSTGSQDITSFDADGFSLAAANTNILHNANTVNYVARAFLANGAGVSNTDGSITSTVSVSSTGAWSFGTFTGTGANGTVGHGLGGAPEFIIVKNRTDATIPIVYHAGVASDAETDYLDLSSTIAATDNNLIWNDTAPTSTVFSVGSNNAVNDTSDAMFFMAFRSVPGICKVFSYAGNANANGTLVYLGFKPAFLLRKNIGVAENWPMHDSARNPSNPVNTVLMANSTSSESTLGTSGFIDFLSNGFKCRDTDSRSNSAHTFIGVAIAESAIGGGIPFPNAR